MFSSPTQFFLHWFSMTFCLWMVSNMFHGIRFANKQSLFVAALLLGLANAIVRPVLIFVTLPLTLVTFGLFLLVVNALMLLLVAGLVKGFKVSGFWTAFFAAIFISLFSFMLDMLFSGSSMSSYIPAGHGVMV